MKLDKKSAVMYVTKVVPTAVAKAPAPPEASSADVENKRRPALEKALRNNDIQATMVGCGMRDVGCDRRILFL